MMGTNYIVSIFILFVIGIWECAERTGKEVGWSVEGIFHFYVVSETNLGWKPTIDFVLYFIILFIISALRIL